MRVHLALACLVASSAGCSVAESDSLSPQARAVVVSTSGCGDASASQGSGVLVDDGKVVTAAHVVAGTSAVEVTDANGETFEAVVLAHDPRRDLALLGVADLSATRVVSAPLVPGETGEIVGAAASGIVPFTTVRAIDVNIDDVRGDGRSVRAGYELAARTTSGDSGAGAYDRTDRLGAIIFASSRDDDTVTWATASSVVEDFLTDPDVRGRFVCNPDRSRLELNP